MTSSIAGYGNGVGLADTSGEFARMCQTGADKLSGASEAQNSVSVGIYDFSGAFGNERVPA